MWLNSIYLKTLRDFRIPMLAWGLGLGVLMTGVLVTVPSLLSTPEARASIVALGPSFAWFAEPVKIDTPGGYATWKYGLSILVVAIWPILSETRMLRGEEERGSMDSLLSLPRGRVRVALEKLAAMWTALLVMGLLVAAFAFAGGAKVGADFGLGGAVMFGIDLALISAVFGAIALLLSQFTLERRTAAGAAGGALLVFIVMDMVHRVVPNTVWLSQLSPVYYYNLSKPLVQGYGTNPSAMLILLAGSILLSGTAVWLFARRDVGAVVARPGFLQVPQRRALPMRALPQGDWSLRSVYSRSLAMVVIPTLWWTLGIAGFAGWMIIIVNQTEAKLRTILQGSSLLGDFLKIGGSDKATNATFLSALFVFLPLLLMAFAVTQANRWSADEEDGRLELVLSTPQPRLLVLLARFAALSTATIVISVLTLGAAVAASAATGLSLNGGNLAAATLSMIPLGLLVAAIGYLFSGWLRTEVDTGLLSLLLVIWFFISFIGPGLNWPDTALRLSPFYYYGTPLVHGFQAMSVLGVVAVAALALGLGTLRFARKDVGV